MDKNSSTEKKSWIQTKAFYAVAVSLVLVIAGIAGAIYNVSKANRALERSFSEPNTVYSVPKSEKNTSDSQANANKTDVADDRSTTEKTTANDLNRPYTGYYLLPLNSKVIKDFSDGDMVYSKTMDDWRVHNGIDLNGSIGTNVIAVQDGKVTDVYTDPMWGEVVLIQHGNGLSVKYCGVKSSFKKDAAVEQGQVIGTLSEIPIESKDEAHLHIETAVDGKIAAPIKVLNLLSESTSTAE